MNRRQLFARTVGALAAAAVAPIVAKMPKQQLFYEYAGAKYWQAARYSPRYLYGRIVVDRSAFDIAPAFERALHNATVALKRDMMAELSGDEAVI